MTHLVEGRCKHELSHASRQLLPHEGEQPLLEDTETEGCKTDDSVDARPHCIHTEGGWQLLKGPACCYALGS